MRFNQNRKFGVEIEGKGVSHQVLANAITAAGVDCAAEGYNHRTRSYWKVISDASVPGGFELVSPPMTGEAGLEDVKTVLKAAREVGARVDTDCGVHVHHDAAGIRVKALAVLGHNYSKYFPVFKSIFPMSRYSNTYCRIPAADDFLQYRNHRNIDGYGGIAARDRYNAVNFASLLVHGTVEFRQHAGSLNGTKVTAWIVFTQALVEASIASPRFSKRRDENSHLRGGLLSWLRLYKGQSNGDDGLDAVSSKAIRYIAKKAGWKATNIFRPRTSSAPTVTTSESDHEADAHSEVGEPVSVGMRRCNCGCGDFFPATAAFTASGVAMRTS